MSRAFEFALHACLLLHISIVHISNIIIIIYYYHIWSKFFIYVQLFSITWIFLSLSIHATPIDHRTNHAPVSVPQLTRQQRAQTPLRSRNKPLWQSLGALTQWNVHPMWSERTTLWNSYDWRVGLKRDRYGWPVDARTCVSRNRCLGVDIWRSSPETQCKYHYRVSNKYHNSVSIITV